MSESPNAPALPDRVVVVGGHGKIAQQLIPLLVDAGSTPIALVRSAEQVGELERLGAQVRLLDLEEASVARFAAAFAGADAVVFTAGGGADGNIERKRIVDFGGSVSSQQAAAAAGISRFVQVSAIGVDQPVADDAEPSWRAYVEAKRDADAALRASDLSWTILRPGRLTDDAATGMITLAERVERGDITRADVAATIVAVLAEPRAAATQWELTGGHTPIADAVSANLS